jgi:tetratricopeptide (TPR) repeat protein
MMRACASGVALCLALAVSPPGAAEDKQAEAASVPAEALEAARSAFWQGDYGDAVRRYRDLIEAHPDPAYLRGELGNVLYARDDRDEAAEAYYQAAVRLLEQGDYARASDLYHVLAGLDAERANDLARRLWRRPRR